MAHSMRCAQECPLRGGTIGCRGGGVADGGVKLRAQRTARRGTGCGRARNQARQPIRAARNTAANPFAGITQIRSEGPPHLAVTLSARLHRAPLSDVRRRSSRIVAPAPCRGNTKIELRTRPASVPLSERQAHVPALPTLRLAGTPANGRRDGVWRAQRAKTAGAANMLRMTGMARSIR